MSLSFMLNALPLKFPYWLLSFIILILNYLKLLMDCSEFKAVQVHYPLLGLKNLFNLPFSIEIFFNLNDTLYVINWFLCDRIFFFLNFQVFFSILGLFTLFAKGNNPLLTQGYVVNAFSFNHF
jgi:hypothetical protein